MTEKSGGDLVIVRESTGLLLSSKANTGVDVSSRDSDSATHLNGRAGLHHSRYLLEQKIPLSSDIFGRRG